jgi:hypothetical protein
MDDKEAKVAAWEMCVYCFDALLLNYANSEDFFNSVNPEIPVARRCGFIDRIYLPALLAQQKGQDIKAPLTQLTGRANQGHRMRLEQVIQLLLKCHFTPS